MTDDRGKALVPRGPASLGPVSRLAERTLAERVEREEQALVATRTLVVGPGGYVTISEAVDTARDGDTVLVRPGRYEESVIVEGKTITIRGDGERNEIVVGKEAVGGHWEVCVNSGRPFTLIGTESTLSDLTIVGGGDLPKSAAHGGSGSLGTILVAGGAPHLDRLSVRGALSVHFEGGSHGSFTNSLVHGSGEIAVWDGAAPRIEGNEIWGSYGIQISGTGSNPLVRANRINGEERNTTDLSPFDLETGIYISDGASPRIEQNEIWATTQAGIEVRGVDTNPILRANLVHDCRGVGILVQEGASPRIEENEIWGNARAGIEIDHPGTDPLVRQNLIHDGAASGILVHGGASGMVEGNEIYASASAGLWISGVGTAPVVRANHVHEGRDVGISVVSASPTIISNRIANNRRDGIRVWRPGASPTVHQNTIAGNYGFGIRVMELAGGKFEDNIVTANGAGTVRIEGGAPASFVENVTD